MKINTWATCLLMACFAAPAFADNVLCQQKMAGLEQQIEQAKAAGNGHRVRGLERAVANVKAHCTDEDLIADKKEDIADQQEDIAEILEDIAEKRSEGRTDKVNKLERKLQQEQDKLQRLQEELKGMQ